MTLGDALTYADELGADYIVDVATLTGSMIAALGNEYAGVFSPEDDIATRLVTAATITGENLWRMPFVTSYRKLLESNIADLKYVRRRLTGTDHCAPRPCGDPPPAPSSGVSASGVRGAPVGAPPCRRLNPIALRSRYGHNRQLNTRAGDCINAAVFLKEFVTKTKQWAHIDIAPTCWQEREGGATGYGVRALIAFVEALSGECP